MSWKVKSQLAGGAYSSVRFCRYAMTLIEGYNVWLSKNNWWNIIVRQATIVKVD